MQEYSNVKIFANIIDQPTLEQIYGFQKSPLFVDVPIRIMPDAHCGTGSCVGMTAPITDKIAPAVVGTDIGCGVRVVKLGNIDIDFERLDSVMHNYVPSGRDVGASRNEAKELIRKLRCYRELHDLNRLEASLGTLGGGNHFGEIDTGADGCKYLVIHTGSRNLGTQIAKIYQYRALRERKHKAEVRRKELAQQLKAEGREKEIEAMMKELKAKEQPLPADLSYVSGENLDDYMHDMRLCQKFAVLNRKIIADTVIQMMKWKVLDSFESVHNYIGDDNIVRKGAVSAYKDEKVIIPLNMRDGSLLCIGKGNADWNYSAPHGAGRIMSRSQARKNISLDDFKETMKGIYTTSVGTSTIDESPFAYKPADVIIEAIKDTVDIIEVIKPIYNFKAGGD